MTLLGLGYITQGNVKDFALIRYRVLQFGLLKKTAYLLIFQKCNYICRYETLRSNFDLWVYP